MKNKSIIYLIPIFYYLGICYLSSRSGSDLPPIWFLDFPHSDKLIHFLVFGLWSALIAICLYLKPINFFKSKKGMFILFSVMFIMAALDEYHQSFVPGRDQDINDWLADCIGIIFFFYLTQFFLNKKLLRSAK